LLIVLYKEFIFYKICFSDFYRKNKGNCLAFVELYFIEVKSCMMKTQNVTIKGTKDGLLLRLDDTCSFFDLLKEVEEKLFPHSQLMDDSHEVSVRIHTGNRLLTKEQEQQLRELISPEKNLIIASIESNVILKEELNRIRTEKGFTVVTKIVRSGQILEITGDLLLIGDVNPGGKVMASGNIFILGRLKGMAHAGMNGNEEAVICAATMTPTQLRIADYFGQSLDRNKINDESECAYLNQEKQLVIDRLSVLNKIRPNINRFVEGGLS